MSDVVELQPPGSLDHIPRLIGTAQLGGHFQPFALVGKIDPWQTWIGRDLLLQVAWDRRNRHVEVRGHSGNRSQNHINRREPVPRDDRRVHESALRRLLGSSDGDIRPAKLAG